LPARIRQLVIPILHSSRGICFSFGRAAVAGLFNYFNRFNNTFQMEPTR